MENLVSKAKRLTDLADYQAGSIVSRTIMDKKQEQWPFLLFDKGQGLSEHTALFDAVVYIIDGETEITVSSKPFSS